MTQAATPPLPVAGPHQRVYLGRIPAGYEGTRRTVAYMAQLIRQGAKDLKVRQHAIAILRMGRVRPKDHWGEVGALFRWVQSQVRYTRDPHRVEVLHGARRMVELRAGDCDDMTILLGAMVKSIGYPVRVVLTGSDPSRPKRFSHVYLEAEVRGQWVALDPTMPHPMGWAPRAATRERHPVEPGPAVQIPGTRTAGLACECACGRQAANLRREFAGAAADRAVRMRHRRVIPAVVADLGELVGLIYRSDKWEPGVPKNYIHLMRRRPRLASHPDGRQLYIVGGSYRVTRRGIEG